jgi:hypothetical protein
MRELAVAFRICFADSLNMKRTLCFIHSALSETNDWTFFLLCILCGNSEKLSQISYDLCSTSGTVHGHRRTEIRIRWSFGWWPTGRLYIAFGKSLCTYKRCWKWCPRASIQLILLEYTVTHFTSIALQPLFNNWIQWNNSTLQRQLRYWQPNLSNVV